MDFILNTEELALLCGLPHIQQLTYLRGIRPYMDVKTGLVGIKRGISYQSIADNLYVEAHQGIKSITFTRTQVRRSLPGLVRVGLISIQSERLKLVLKCELATKGYFASNKVVTNSSQHVVTNPSQKNPVDTEFLESVSEKADIGKTQKVVTPLKEDLCIYLLSQFEKFWLVYPEKKSKQNAWLAFQLLNPNPMLFERMLGALTKQIAHREAMQLSGTWVPPWKYPANWINKKCWEDEITINITEEKNHATNRTSRKNQSSSDMFWDDSTDDGYSSSEDNILQFRSRER